MCPVLYTILQKVCFSDESNVNKLLFSHLHGNKIVTSHDSAGADIKTSEC